MAKKKTETPAPASTGATSAQLERLTAMEGKLLDVAIVECNPEDWINQEKAEALALELEAEALACLDRGDKDKAKELMLDAVRVRRGWKGERYWEKKNANQTLALLTRIVMYRQRLKEYAEQGGKGVDDFDAKEKAEIKAAEKEAGRRLALVKRRA